MKKFDELVDVLKLTEREIIYIGGRSVFIRCNKDCIAKEADEVFEYLANNGFPEVEDTFASEHPDRDGLHVTGSYDAAWPEPRNGLVEIHDFRQYQ